MRLHGYRRREINARRRPACSPKHEVSVPLAGRRRQLSCDRCIEAIAIAAQVQQRQQLGGKGGITRDSPGRLGPQVTRDVRALVPSSLNRSVAGELHPGPRHASRAIAPAHQRARQGRRRETVSGTTPASRTAPRHPPNGVAVEAATLPDKIFMRQSMAHVRKGHTVPAPQWWKHLRDWKRTFWKKQRKAFARDARRQIDDPRRCS